MKNIPQAFSLESFHKFVGLPYEDMDCWELIKFIYLVVFDIELPAAKYAHKETFLKIDEPELGDIILINILGIPSHVAMYIDEKNLIHSRQGTGSVIEPLRKWKSKIEGIYRWPK